MAQKLTQFGSLQQRPTIIQQLRYLMWRIGTFYKESFGRSWVVHTNRSFASGREKKSVVTRIRNPKESFISDQFALHATVHCIPYFDGVIHRGRANFAALVKPCHSGNTLFVADQCYEWSSRQWFPWSWTVQFQFLRCLVVNVIVDPFFVVRLFRRDSCTPNF